eukprot:8068142-Pyramimonas_sp.AAC.1
MKPKPSCDPLPDEDEGPAAGERAGASGLTGDVIGDTVDDDFPSSWSMVMPVAEVFPKLAKMSLQTASAVVPANSASWPLVT